VITAITAYINYQNIDECRVLNNKIKHVGKVDDALAKFSFFSNLKNKSLEKIEYDLQRYSKSVFEYIGFVAERADDIAVFSRMRGNKILERLTVQDSNTPHSCDYRYIIP